MRLKIAESVAPKISRRHHVSVFEVYDAMNDRRKYRALIRKERHLGDEGRRVEERTYYLTLRRTRAEAISLVIANGTKWSEAISVFLPEVRLLRRLSPPRNDKVRKVSYYIVARTMPGR